MRGSAMNSSTGARSADLGKKDHLPAYMLWFLLFLAMVIGMIAKSLYDTLLNNERIEIGLGLLLRPDVFVALLASPMVFGAVYAFLRESPSNLPAFIFAFQNGFFWKTVFGRLEAEPTFQN